MCRRLIIAILLSPALLSPAQGQMRGGAGAHFSSGPVSARIAHGRSSSRFARGALFLGDGFYGDYFYPDYPPEPLALPLPRFVDAKFSPAATPEPERKADPLLIEWRGDRFVRIGGTPQSVQSNTPLDYADSREAKSSPAPSHDLPPAVLIYRDGHREELRDYAIVGGTIYARGDYWQNGYWTKNIQLSTLNLPATLEANQQNGTRFVLPSGPNQVVTRP